MTKRALPASTNTSDPPERARPFATEPERFALYAKTRSFVAVAKAAGVSPQAIAAQANRHAWCERVTATDNKRALSKAAVASQEAIEVLDRVDQEVRAETATWDDPENEHDKLARAAGVVQVVERGLKVRREALADLPPEPEAPLDLAPLTLAQLLLWMAQEEMADALKALKPGALSITPKPGALAAFTALVESNVGREFLIAYGRDHGLNGLPLVSSDLGIAPVAV